MPMIVPLAIHLKNFTYSLQEERTQLFSSSKNYIEKHNIHVELEYT